MQFLKPVRLTRNPAVRINVGGDVNLDSYNLNGGKPKQAQVLDSGHKKRQKFEEEWLKPAKKGGKGEERGTKHHIKWTKMKMVHFAAKNEDSNRRPFVSTSPGFGLELVLRFLSFDCDVPLLDVAVSVAMNDAFARALLANSAYAR